MAGYRLSKLGCNVFRNFAFGSNKFRTCVQRKTIIFGSSSGFGDESKQTPTYNAYMPNFVGERRYHIALSPKHLATNCGEFRQISDHPNKNLMISNEQRRYYHSNIDVMVPSLVALITLGVPTVAYLSLLEEIPFSKRKNLALIPRRVERLLADRDIEQEASSWKVLPASHPSSLRVKFVTEKVMEALRRGLRDKKNWGGPSYASTWIEAFKALWEGKEYYWISSTTNDEIRRRERHIDQYIEVVNSWRVMVVDDPDTINSYAYANGTIVVHTGYLEILESDAELATAIGHEVAHCVARHWAERLTFSSSLLGIIGYVWNGFDIPSLLGKLQTLEVDPHLSIRHELEADYIGMLLMASAGYDPHVAFTANKKIDEKIKEQRQDNEDSKDDGDDYSEEEEEEEDADLEEGGYYKYRYYPSEEERTQNLTQALKEAIAVYKESATGLSV